MSNFAQSVFRNIKDILRQVEVFMINGDLWYPAERTGHVLGYRRKLNEKLKEFYSTGHCKDMYGGHTMLSKYAVAKLAIQSPSVSAREYGWLLVESIFSESNQFSIDTSKRLRWNSSTNREEIIDKSTAEETTLAAQINQSLSYSNEITKEEKERREKHLAALKQAEKTKNSAAPTSINNDDDDDSSDDDIEISTYRSRPSKPPVPSNKSIIDELNEQTMEYYRNKSAGRRQQDN